MAKVYDSPAAKGSLWPPSSGAGDGAISVGAEGEVDGKGHFVIGHTVENAPTELFSKLKALDGKS